MQILACVVKRNAFWGALACLSVFVSPAAAVTTATLIGPDLNAQTVEVASLSDGTLHYFDNQRTLQSSTIDGFVQLRSVGGEDGGGRSPAVGVWLTDGQRFTGDWVGPTPDGLGLRWRHPLVGTVAVPLDEIARVNWVADEGLVAQRGAPTADTVIFTNGDTLSGFVSSVTDQGIELVPDTGGAGSEAVTIPFGRIVSMSSSNPDRLTADPYHRVSLVDGTRIWADRLRITGDYVYCRVIPPGGTEMELKAPITELARIDFWAGGLRLIDLAELPMRTTTEARVFGLSMPVRVTGPGIKMHAPTAVVFDLPDGAVRLSAVAELDSQGAPADIADWSDFQVVVSVQSTEAGRFQVTGSEPIVWINTPISGPGLTIRLDPGVNGPILDRLLLRDAVILVSLPMPEPSGDPDR